VCYLLAGGCNGCPLFNPFRGRVKMAKRSKPTYEEVLNLKGTARLKGILRMMWDPFTRALQELSEEELNRLLNIEVAAKCRSSYIDRIRARLVAVNQEKINEQVKERIE
jgi:hypothetical protein